MESIIEESKNINKISEEKNIFQNKTNPEKQEQNLNFKSIESLGFTNTITGGFTNSFCVFFSKDNILSLIFTLETNRMIYYSIIDKKEIISIKNAHNTYINNYIHFFDKDNKRDLIISISCVENNLKLWDINEIKCLLEIKRVNQFGLLFSACFLYENKELYILASNYNSKDPPESIKVYNLKGEIVNVVNDSNKQVFFIDTYYDKNKLSNYIITCNKGFVTSFDYYKNEIYHTYIDRNDDDKIRLCAAILDTLEYLKLIESCYDGNIRIWDFNTGELLNKIRVIYRQLYGFCIWDENHLLVGSNNKGVNLIDIKRRKVLKRFFEHNSRVVTIKKIKHKKYGECFLSQGADLDEIKLWVNNKDYIFDDSDTDDD